MSDKNPLDRDPLHGDARRNTNNEVGATQSSSTHTDIPATHADVKTPHTDINTGFHTDVPGIHSDTQVVPHADTQTPTGEGETQTP